MNKTKYLKNGAIAKACPYKKQPGKFVLLLSFLSVKKGKQVVKDTEVIVGTAEEVEEYYNKIK
jgi:hypothetical protein